MIHQSASFRLSFDETPTNHIRHQVPAIMLDYQRKSIPSFQQRDTTINSHIYASFAAASHYQKSNGILAENFNMWWDEELIEATVTRQFVASKLRPDEQLRLDEPLGFGDGLTDDTYMEWIELKAKRIFLILVDLGVPDQIFGVIDDSWDDDDLPVPLDQVERLRLTYDKDSKLERKFFNRQFIYLLRNLRKGDRLYYDEEEVVPLELAERKAVGQVTGLTQSNVDKVHLPGRPNDIFIRRRVPLGIILGRMPQEEFLAGVEAMRAIEHNHLISLWASYIQHDCGYLLLTPVNDSTLKSFLAVTPPSVKILSKLDRRVLLLNWLHCLADAVAFLHEKGASHRNIKPSTVMLDQDNHIFLGDSGIFSTTALVGEKRGFDKETYDYAAPEQAQRPNTTAPILVPMTSPVTRPGSSRRTTLSNSPDQTQPTFSETQTLYTTHTGESYTSTSPPKQSPPKRNSFSRHDPQKADIFALGTVFLEVITFILKRTTKNFAAHRSAKNKTAGRGGGLPDSSFHKNLGQVESWIGIISKEASKKEDKIFLGISPILTIVERMVAANPDERPPARHIQERISSILTESCGLGVPCTTATGEFIPSKGRIHCDAARTDEGFNFGFEELRIASQRAAAQACASVNPLTTETRVIGFNGGIVNAIERTSSLPVDSWYTGEHEERTQANHDPVIVPLRTVKTTGSEFKGNSRNLRGGVGQGKIKPKAKKWEAPTYAEISFA